MRLYDMRGGGERERVGGGGGESERKREWVGGEKERRGRIKDRGGSEIKNKGNKTGR